MFKKLTKTQRDVLTLILILINIGIVIFWIHLWITLRKPTLPPKIEKSIPKTQVIPQEILEKYSAPPDGKTEKIPQEILEKYSAPQ
jgi:hypothetical protein